MANDNPSGASLPGAVYVSYNWQAEHETKVVDRLEKVCKQRGIALKRDRNEVHYRDSIRAYMAQLAAGSQVILVLSDGYFKSPYCMYELMEICRKPEFRKRVYPIVLSGTRFSRPRDRIPYLKYWESEIAGLKAELAEVDRTYTTNLNQDLDDYAEYRRLIDGLLTELADMNALTQDIHLDSDFAAILDFIAPPGASDEAAPPSVFRQSDQEFKCRIQNEIKAFFDRRPKLFAAVRDHAGRTLTAPPSDVAASLCNAPPFTAVDDILLPATRQCLKGLDAREFEETWKDAKGVLGWLLLSAVSSEWVAQREQRGDLQGLRFEVMAQTTATLELVSARYRQHPARFSAKPGTPELDGEDAISPRVESGWSDDLALERLLAEIWSSVFPERRKEALNDKEVRQLRARLASHEKHKTRHYYVAVTEDDRNPLWRPEFYARLRQKLPDIAVIYIQPASGEPALIVEDEIAFVDAIIGFLDIPRELNR